MRAASLAPPLALLVGVVGFWLAQSFGLLPPPTELLALLTDFLKAGGGWAIGAAAAVENIVLINTYFPGSIVILGVMASTHGDPSAALMVFGYIFVGQLVGLSISGIIGSLIPNLQPDHRVTGRAWYLLAALFWHPHSASAVAFAMGAKRLRARFWITLLGCLVWSIFWALVMYNGLGVLVEQVGWDYISFLVALVWLFVEIRKIYRFSKDKKRGNNQFEAGRREL